MRKKHSLKINTIYWDFEKYFGILWVFFDLFRNLLSVYWQDVQSFPGFRFARFCTYHIFQIFGQTKRGKEKKNSKLRLKCFADLIWSTLCISYHENKEKNFGNQSCECMRMLENSVYNSFRTLGKKRKSVLRLLHRKTCFNRIIYYQNQPHLMEAIQLRLDSFKVEKSSYLMSTWRSY